MQCKLKEEMTNNGIAFETHESNIKKLMGHEEMTAHLAFDVRSCENSRQKVRHAANGHMTSALSAITCSAVVS